MKITCNNFGPLKNATIDINKDLIILCGKNNSGKTYLSYLLYGILMGRYEFDVEEQFIEIQDLRFVDDFNDTTKKVAVFSVNLSLIRLQHKNQIEVEFGKLIKERLHQVFPDTTNFNETLFEVDLGTSTQASNRDFYRRHAGSMSAPIMPGSISAFVSFTKNEKDNFIKFRAHSEAFKNEEKLTSNILKIVNNIALSIILINSHSDTQQDAYFFPSERLAIDLFIWDIIGSRKKLQDDMKKRHTLDYIKYSANNQGISSVDQFKAPNLDTDKIFPLPIRDYILRASSYKIFELGQGYLNDLGHELEEKIGGTITMVDEKVIGFEIQPGAVIPVKLTSSTVKSLSSFIFYLKYESRANHVVFFDEPELNLHPSIQRDLAVILAKMVRKGVKLVISTHSDFMLREFNNLIMLNSDSLKAKELRIKYSYLGYGINSVLNPDRVGVNIFSDRTIIESPVTETGFDATSIDDVITEQNRIAEDIYFNLY